MNLNIPRIDLDAEINGRWHTFQGDIKLKIARMNNEDFIAGIAEMRDLVEEEEPTEDERGKMLALLYARYILRDWSGVIDKDTKKPVPYTPDAGSQILEQKQYKELLNFVVKRSASSSENWEEKTQAMGEG